MDENLFEISIIICTYNREKFLPEALESIKIQDVDRYRFELIVIDNFCTDNTSNIVNSFINQNPEIHIKYYFESNKGLSFARNRGITESKSPIISYIDDDVILPKTYINEVLDFFESYPTAVGMGGKVIPKYEDEKEPIWMNKYLNGFVAKVDHGETVKKFSKDMKYPAGCNMTYKKSVLLEVNGFNNELKFRSDDKYIFKKVSEISNEIYYLPDAWLYHYIDNTRLEPVNFKKLFMKTGNEEKRRILSEGSFLEFISKLIELMFKFTASLIIFLSFVTKGYFLKGKYVVLSQWYTLIGYLKKDVFVR